MVIIPGTVILIFVIAFGSYYFFLQVPEEQIIIVPQEPVEGFAQEEEDAPEYGPDEDPPSEGGSLPVLEPEPKPKLKSTYPEDFTTQEDCEMAGYFWYHGLCHGEPDI